MVVVSSFVLKDTEHSDTRSTASGSTRSEWITEHTEHGEWIDPRHPFCSPGPCMQAEGRRNGTGAKHRGKYRSPAICKYRHCHHCHHPDHWNHNRRHDVPWHELMNQHRLQEAVQEFNKQPREAVSERYGFIFVAEESRDPRRCTSCPPRRADHQDATEPR